MRLGVDHTDRQTTGVSGIGEEPEVGFGLGIWEYPLKRRMAHLYRLILMQGVSHHDHPFERPNILQGMFCVPIGTV